MRNKMDSTRQAGAEISPSMKMHNIQEEEKAEPKGAKETSE